jgi:hypothetical protein
MQRKSAHTRARVMENLMARHAKGTMVLSLDLELSWGRFDKLSADALKAQSSEERKHIKSLLALLDRYEIPATWATVGHLMLENCARDPSGQAHADLSPQPRYSWFPKNWYDSDPCTNTLSDPGWYAPDIVEWIRLARVRHEIGSHSFGHIYYGDPECSSAIAMADLKAAVDVAASQGLTLTSFVFPRNQVGHLEVLKDFGMQAYRGIEPPLIRSGNRRLKKAVHFLDQLCALKPRPVRAEETLPGLWNIPGNHLYMARYGMRKMIPMASRVRKGQRGIDQAVANGELYHLWFHPFNLNGDSVAMLRGLEQIFSYAKRMREKGLLQILTMGDYARRLTEEKKRASAKETVLSF